MELTPRRITIGIVCIALIAALWYAKRRYDWQQRFDASAAAIGHKFPKEVDWGPLETLTFRIDGQEVIGGDLEFVHETWPPVEAEATFSDPGEPGTRHWLVITYRPLINGKADWSNLQLTEIKVYLESRDPHTARIKMPPGEYETRTYMRIEAFQVGGIPDVYYLGNGTLRVLPAEATTPAAAESA